MPSRQRARVPQCRTVALARPGDAPFPSHKAYLPRAQLTIMHDPMQFSAQTLQPVLGVHQPGAYGGSWTEFSGVPLELIDYARNAGGAYLLFCVVVSSTRLDVTVEPLRDSTVTACDDVWGNLRKALKSHRPRCTAAQAYESGRPSRTAFVGFRYQAWRRDVLVPSGVGLASAILGVGVGVVGSNPAPLVAAVPPVCNGIWQLGSALNDWRTQRLRWQE